MGERFKNAQWTIRTAENHRGSAANCEEAQLAVLMDIRDELQTLSNVFRCQNALAIPDLLRAIKKNTTKRKYIRKAQQ